MLQVSYKERGPVPHSLIEVQNYQTPTLEAGQVLLEVLAAPINPSDLLTLTGEYAVQPPLPAVGGGEGVGRISEIGPNVEGLTVGQTVLLPLGCGSWQTHVVAKASHLMVIEQDVDPQQLSMIQVNPPTALLLLTQFVQLKEGDWLIQNAANSAVGSYLIQLAHSRGIKTVNVVRRESLIAPLTEMGADVVIVDGEDLAQRIKLATNNAPIALGIDAVGGKATGRLADSLSNNAIIVNYGLMSGESCQISPQALIFRNIKLCGFWLAHWFETTTREQQMTVYSALAQNMACGALKTDIHQTFDISEAREALELAEQGARSGKVLFVPK